MKRFIIKLTLTIVVPVLLFFGSYEVIMRLRPNRWTYKSEMCERVDLAGVEVLVLGNSHTLEAVNPSLLGRRAISLAQMSQSYNYDCLLFDKYLPSMPSLRYVIMDLSHFSPWEMLEEGPSAWLCKRYAVCFGLRNHRWWEYRYRYYFSEISPALLRALAAPPEANPFDSLGFLANLERCDDMELDAEKTYMVHCVDTLRRDIYDTNMAMLDRMIDRCEQRGIKVLFVSTPMHEAYRRRVEPRRLELASDFAGKLCRHGNVRWLDLYDAPGFVDSDFVNSDHLSPQGAEKCTEIVKELL